MALSQDQLRELAIDTMASWALDGLHPSPEVLEDIRALVDGRMTQEQFREKALAGAGADSTEDGSLDE